MYERKMRLFAVSCCRNVWDHFSMTLQHVIETAENYAEGRVTEQEAYEAVEVALIEGGGNIDRLEAVSSAALYAAHPTIEPDDIQGIAWGVAYDTRLLARGSDTQPYVARDIFGNPFRTATIDPALLAWRDATIPKLAQAAYDERELPSGHLDTKRLAILADALEEAGCTNDDVLAHLRGPGPHVRGCWVVDLLLHKE
jgi:hypothetical protein